MNKNPIFIRTRILIGFAAIWIPGNDLHAQQKSLVNTSQSPAAVLSMVDMDDVTLLSGLWADRFRICKDSMVPAMWEILSDPEVSHSFRNFEVASGTVEGCHAGPPFHNGDFYKWFEALAAVYMQTSDPGIDHLMDSIIPYIEASQRGDGYIHTPVIIEYLNNRDSCKTFEFRERLDFETYNMGHLMTAACVHSRATGKTSLLVVAEKAADFLIEFCKRAPSELARNAICPSHYMGVMELYRTTGKEKYRELARNLIEIRELIENGTDHNQDRIPISEQTMAIGHAVRANYLYAGIADLVAETGDNTLMKPLELIWDDLVRSKLYITGGCGALYDGVSPDGTSYSPPYIQQVHQAYGRAYQLPNSTAHNESCANIGNILWNWRMLTLTGDARFTDVIEQTLYNALLASVSLDGRRYFYTNPLRVYHDLPYTLRWSKEREEYISRCNCCPPNIVRTIAEAGSYLYAVSDRGLWLNIYSASELRTNLPDGSVVELIQEGDYPWAGNIRIRLKKVPGHTFSLFLRIPGWSDGALLSVNGRDPGQILQPGTYTEIRRQWKAGDLIELELPLQTRLMAAHPLAEEISGQVTVQRGPIVYCLESTDLPEGARIADLALPSGTEFLQSTIRIDGALLVSLLAEARVVQADSWGKSLYKELTPGVNYIPVRLIPYFAWGNRGKSEMSVWLPVDY